MNLTRLFQLLFLLILILTGFWYIGSALTGLLLLTIAVVGCRLIFIGHVWHAYTLTNLMLVYLIWLFVVTFTSNVPTTSILTFAILAGMPVMYIIASNTSSLPEIWKNLRVILFIMAIGFSLWAIWQVINNIGYGQAVGPLLDRNAFAALINLLWFPAAYLLLVNKSNRGLLLLLSTGLFIITTALFATASRGGIATWLLLLPFLLWAGYQYNKSKKIVGIIMLIALLAYLCSTLLLNSNVADRTFQLANDPSAIARLLLWKSSIKMTFAHPIFGTGWGTFGAYYPVYRFALENTTSGFFAHNDFLQLAAEGGLIALFLQLSIMVGLFLQLKKSLSHAENITNLESIALLLGVLAIFIQASVNFIFYFAFMNILSGLYLARVSQLIYIPKLITLPNFNKVRLSIKGFGIASGILLIAAPFILHLITLACLVDNRPGLKIINILSPKFTAYKVAHLITTIRPQETIAQELMLQTAEYFLASNINTLDEIDRELLNDELKRCELIRTYNANSSNIGVREAKLLVTYGHIFEGETAYIKAYQILNDNLKADPYHANSMIAIARLQVVGGSRKDGLATLEMARHQVLSRRDQQLISVEILRQLTAPNIISELDDIEKLLHQVRSDSETGKTSILSLNFYENIDKKLNKILIQISKI